MFRRLLTVCAALLLMAVVSSLPTSALNQTGQTPSSPDVQTCIYLGPDYTPVEYWTLNAPQPTARFGFALIAPNGSSWVYAIGGLQSWADALTTNERFNACTNTWETLAPLPVPRGYIQAAELSGRLYIVGGVDHVISGTFGVQNSTWVFDPAHNWWSSAAELPQALGGVALAAANGKLYAFGGFDSRGPSVGDVSTVYEYDPAHDRWTLRGNLPGGARSLAGAVELDGEVYVVGGVSPGLMYGVARNEVYNPATRTWRTAQGLDFYGMTLSSAPDGHLYALGGSHDNNNSWTATYDYDPAVDTWRSIYTPELNDYRNHGLSSGVYAVGRLFLMGGVGMQYSWVPSSTVLSNVNESLTVLESLCESSLQATPEVVVAGDALTYTIVLHGEVSPLPNVILLDPIPTRTTFDAFVDNPAGAIFNASANQVEWNGPLAANPDPITITFRVTVNDNPWTSARLLTNTLSIHNGLNVITREVGTWYAAFDLTASRKEVNRAAAVTGDTITYSLRVQTTSPLSGAVSLIDPIPQNMHYLTGSLASTFGSASYANGQITWSGNLTPHTGIYTNTTADYQWGDSHGNGVVPGVTYGWIEIEHTGRPFSFVSIDNDGCYHTAFPFDFTYYTQVYTKAGISTNGALYFPPYYNGVLYNFSPNNTPIPGISDYQGYEFGRFLAPFWDDLYLSPGWIYYQILGEAPNRKVVYEFSNVSHYASPTQPGDPGTFEMIVFEGSSAILMQYKDMNFGTPLHDWGASASVGIQDTPETGTQYSYNTPSITDRLAILYVPPQRSITYTANFADITFAVTPDVVLPDRTPVTNTATISSPHGQVITREAALLYGAPDFSTSYKTIDHVSVAPSDSPLYTLHINNTGPVDGLVTLTDNVAQEPYLYFWYSSLSYPYGIGHEYSYGIDWTGVVPAHSSAAIRYGVYVNGTVKHGQAFVNTALITDVVAGLVFQPTATITVSKPADLSVNSIGPGAIEPVAPMTYTLRVTNHGPYDTEEPIIVVDTLPVSVTFGDASPGGVFSPTLNAVIWPLDPLMVDATRTLTVAVVAPNTLLGTVLTNTVSVDVPTQDPNLDDNTHVWFTRIGDVPNLMNGTWKTVTPIDLMNGRVATYTVHIVNTGNLTASITLTDPLPSGLIYQVGSSTLDGVPIELYNPTLNQIEWTGVLGVDQTLEATFNVKAIADGGQVTNTVQIDDGAGLIVMRSAALTLPWPVYLPVIWR